MNDRPLVNRVIPCGYKRPLLVARLRIGVGVWLLILTAILYGYGRGSWWGVLLVPAAALNFYLAYRVPRGLATARHEGES
jgi:hypothetical protein